VLPRPVGAFGGVEFPLVPVRLTVSGEPVNPVYAIDAVPVSDKTGVPVGVNEMLNVQLAPLPRDATHVPPLVVAQSEPFVPEYVIGVDAKVIVAPLELVTVTGCAALVAC
jgi:hypothetical protein